MRIVLFGLLLVCLSTNARADRVHIDAEGDGATREMAVSQALASALEQQATGVSIDVAQMSATVAASATNDTEHQATLVETAQEAISRKAGGRVETYRITSVTPAPKAALPRRSPSRSRCSAQRVCRQ